MQKRLIDKVKSKEVARELAIKFYAYLDKKVARNAKKPYWWKRMHKQRSQDITRKIKRYEMRHGY